MGKLEIFCMASVGVAMNASRRSKDPDNIKSMVTSSVEPSPNTHECIKCEESFPKRYKFCPLCGDPLPMFEVLEEVGDGGRQATNMAVLYEDTDGTVLKVYENSNHTKVTDVKVRWNNNGFEVIVPSGQFELLKVKSKLPGVITESQSKNEFKSSKLMSEETHGIGGGMRQRGSHDQQHFSFDSSSVTDNPQEKLRSDGKFSPSDRSSSMKYSCKKIRADVDALSSLSDSNADASSSSAPKVKVIGSISDSNGTIFNIEKALGQGAFGIVFLGHHDGQVDKKYAIKQFKNFRMLNLRQQQEARKEARILKTIKHRNIIGYVDEFICNENMFYVVFEFANCGDLNQLIKKQEGARFTTLEVAQWFTEIVSGIAFLHQNKIMHRDLKPANIVICCASGSTEFQMKVADLGLAKEIDADGSDASAATRAGTPLYMSPEMHNRKHYSYSNDVWALGCILFELCTLNRLFQELGDVFKKVPTVVDFCKIEKRDSTPEIAMQYDAKEWTDFSKVCENILVTTPEERPRCRDLLTTMLEIRLETNKKTKAPLICHQCDRPMRFTTGGYFSPDGVVLGWCCDVCSTDGQLCRRYFCCKEHNYDICESCRDKASHEIVFDRDGREVRVVEESRTTCKESRIDTAEWFQVISEHDVAFVKSVLEIGGAIDVNVTNENSQTALSIAADSKDVAILRALLTLGNLNTASLCESDLDTSLQDQDGTRVLDWAVSSGDVGVVNAVLQLKDTNINSQANDGSAALHLAIRDDNPNVVKFLLEHGCDANVQNNEKETALHLAVRQNSVSVVNALLQHADIKINLKDQAGNTAAFSAVHYSMKSLEHGQCDVEVIRSLLGYKGVNINLNLKNESVDKLDFLLEHGQCDVKVTKSPLGYKGVNINLKKESVDKLEYLHQPKYTDKDTRPHPGDTVLHLAARHGHVELAKICLAHQDIDTNIQNQVGDSALHLAVKKNIPEIVESLVFREDTNINLQNFEGITPLHYSIDHAKNYSGVFKSLLEHKNIAVNLQNNPGSSPWPQGAPLHWAAETNEYPNVASSLLKHSDIEVNVKNQESDQTALHKAVRNPNPEVLEVFIEDANIDVNLQDREGCTPLHQAVYASTLEDTRELWRNAYGRVVKTVLDHPNVDINSQNKAGNTPLHIAASQSSSNLVERLLEHPNINVHLKNDQDQTASQVAHTYEREEIRLGYQQTKFTYQIGKTKIKM